ncbi:MAG: TlpA disulfide reductase family protein [Propioniciclava sp.]|uniref:TlpA family protein disulfide reductase n=1 Tax=Propioniciclava sp. TaxID=2038686 RepID=UPI0039E36B86
MRRCRGVAASVVLASVLLAGCAARPVPPEPLPPRPVDPALVAQREAAGIADCPETSASATPVGGGLPDLVLGCLGSERQVNLAALRGTPMVINAWAQWCGPCRLEAPHLREFAERAEGEVLMLGIDYNDPEPALALEFAQSSGWDYPHLTDPLRQTAGPLRVSGIPVTLLVDAEGRIQYRVVGVVESADQLAGHVRTYLGVEV